MARPTCSGGRCVPRERFGRPRAAHRAHACAQGTDDLLGEPFTASGLDRAAERLLNRPGRPANRLRGNRPTDERAPAGVPDREA
ncbi:hypothetical protein [Actinoplanes xinjiangensis]|uniref:hypothetical protein n=1 Tax=Actinoplanes xinjiangensis TaxID=512350 RepID=UPI000D6C9263|nr:hypothetical protein [Actinoplanes xinjiangensis]GIF44223.1 hypothetical protein Axi01nite_85340 [Actinoplanes xinjiangensis]